MNVDNSVNMHDPELKLSICIKNIVIEKTLSQNVDIGPSSFSVNFRKYIQRKMIKSYMDVTIIQALGKLDTQVHY